ncbi:hypothetical protein DE146DRAFT_752511 [Phaeosphaeria sp. MPI-PUGE-AT-0046c]|nr:hypothetical protein DE146DRAFT_752511 [Phaeosphaeria sp. MPI-PUGE-AT-0046c]
MKSTLLASASLFALASAQGGPPSVVVNTTPCGGSNTSPQTFTVVVNTVGVVKIDAKAICGLSITSSTPLPLSSITCQAFKDADGKDVGSALFTATNPARISTNPVEIKGIWCRNPEYSGPGANTTTTASGAGKPTITLGAPIVASRTAEGLVPPAPTGNASATGAPSGYNATTFTGEGSGIGGVRMGLGGLVVAVGAGVLML